MVFFFYWGDRYFENTKNEIGTRLLPLQENTQKNTWGKEEHHHKFYVASLPSKSHTNSHQLQRCICPEDKIH